MKFKISPELIPHNKFHKVTWLLPVKRPRWYYYMNKENRHIIKNEHFEESVDSPLQPLVSFLHSKGVETTPSCAGHHKGKKQFEKIYDSLKEDEEEIRNEGLYLKDIESGKMYTYRNKNYRLPWSKKKFVDRILKYQKSGVIGISTEENIKARLLKLDIPDVKVEEVDDVILIQTHGSSSSGIRKKWEKITKTVKSILAK